MPHPTQLHMDRDMDASYYSVATAEPEHTVRFTVELHYFLNRELDVKGRKKVNKSTVDIKDKVTQQQQLHGSPARQTQHVHDTGGGGGHAHSSSIDHSVGSVLDSIPRYYVTYSIGSACEGRSEVLHPSSSFWSSMHEIDVSLEFLADLYEGPIEFKIFQIKKVWSDDPNEVKEANGGQDSKLGHALSKQTLLFRRASINAIAKRLVTLSRTEALSPKTRRKIDSFRTYVLNNYKQLPVAVKVMAPTFPPPKPSTGESVKVPMAPHLAGSTNPRAALIKESANSSRASSAGSRKSAGAPAGNAGGNDTLGDSLSSNHPARTTGPAGVVTGGANSLMSSISAPSSQHHPVAKHAAHRPSKSTVNATEDLTSICSFVRPKTPPQPHHFDEPGRTLPLVADLPRRHKVLIDKHVHVGSIWVDPSFFFIGDVHAKGKLESKVDGMQDAEVGLSLSGSLLTHRQQESLNPMVITVQSVENLPDRPIPYDQLHRLCHPVYTRFAFLDHPASRHRSRVSVAQQRNIRLDSRHVILTGLHDEDALRDLFLHSKLIVELHDRDKRSSSGALDQERLAGTQNYGVARFSLAELVAGATSLNMKASVVPSDAAKILGATHAVPPGFYLECDTVVKVKVEATCPIFGFAESSSNMSRAVFVIPNDCFDIVKQILDFAEEHNRTVLELDSRELLYEYKLSKDMRKNTYVDFITGFFITDGPLGVLFLEGCVSVGMEKLMLFMQSLNMRSIQQFIDLNLTFSTRTWAGINANVSWIHLPKPLTDLMKDPKLFVRSKFPRGAFQVLRSSNDICEHMFSTIFEISAHGLLPTMEQFEELANAPGMVTSMDQVPWERVAKLIPGVVGLLVDGETLDGMMSLRADSDSTLQQQGGKNRKKYGIDSHFPRSNPIYTWLVEHDRRLSDGPSATNHISTNIEKYSSAYPPAAPLERVPYNVNDTLFLYAPQALNDRESIRLEKIRRIMSRHPRQVLVVAPAGSGTASAKPVPVHEVRAAPWDEQATKLEMYPLEWMGQAPAWNRTLGRNRERSGADEQSLRVESPYVSPHPLDVLAMHPPTVAGVDKGKPRFTVQAPKRPVVGEGDCRVIFVSRDAAADINMVERRMKVEQRIDWDASFPAKAGRGGIGGGGGVAVSGREAK